MTAPTPDRSRAVRIANCSGFLGDRLAAAREMVEGGPIDVLTGDYLAELTMLILARRRLTAGPGTGYARSFLVQLEQVLGTCVERGIKVVANAGGLDPAGLAAAVRELAARLGLRVRVAHVQGDDLMPRLADLAAAGAGLPHLDTGVPLAQAGLQPLAANAYLGGFGIAAALAAGADVVVTGRVTDAALTSGPAAWWHGWTPADLDALAGAAVAGHVIECGAQATGGNYPFWRDVPGLEHVGFPLAEVAADGTSVITKHPGTGGLVSVGTVTAQLLYEIGGPRYLGPDVTARFDTVELAPAGPDRVRICGVRGEPPPDRLKVSVVALGGFRNTITLVVTGLDVEAKADLALRTLWRHVPGGRDAFDEVDVQLLRYDRPDPASADQAQAHLRITVKDRDPARVGRAFTAPAVEMALASYPGMFPTAPPGDASPYGVFWPALVPAALVGQRVVLDGVPPVDLPAGGDPAAPTTRPIQAEVPTTRQAIRWDTMAHRRVPLGTAVGARSGDKGGDANVGLWTAPGLAYRWLAETVTAPWLRTLLPESAGLDLQIYPLPRLAAVNVVVRGLLGRGVADSTRLDPQAKGLAEQLRARLVDIPEPVLAAAGESGPIR